MAESVECYYINHFRVCSNFWERHSSTFQWVSSRAERLIAFAIISRYEKTWFFNHRGCNYTVFDFKWRCIEWSVYDIKVPREPFESIGTICSLIALAVLWCHTLTILRCATYGAFPLHGTVRFGTARYGTVRLSSGRFAFPPQFSTAIEWAGLFTRRYNCAASTAVTSS